MEDREVAIVDAGRLKTMEVRVEVPVEDMARLDVQDERGQIANLLTLKNLFDQDAALADAGGAQTEWKNGAYRRERLILSWRPAGTQLAATRAQG